MTSLPRHCSPPPFFLTGTLAVQAHRVSPVPKCNNSLLASSFTTQRTAPHPPQSLPVPPGRRHRVPPRASWQQSLLPSDPAIPSLQSFYASFPSRYTQAFILGLDASLENAYVTSHEKLTCIRPACAISSNAFPIPLPDRPASYLIRHSLAHTYPNVREISASSMSTANASIVTSLIPCALHSLLGIDHISANSILRTMRSDKKQPIGQNRASNILAIFHACYTRVAGAAIIDAPSNNDSSSSVTLGGIIFIEKCVTKMYGESIYSDPVGIQVDPSFAVAVANAAEVACFLDRRLFDICSVRVDEMQDVFNSCGNQSVILQQDHLHYNHIAEYRDFESRAKDTKRPLVGEVWQLTADDVLSLSDDQLRSVLRLENVAVRDVESRQSLLGKLVPLLDEVHRRELGIQLAAEREMFQLAASLQKSRSKRGLLYDQLRKAEDEQNWTRVAKVAAELKRLEQKIQDITAEPGSYDADLDQDDWYRPCR